MLNHEEQQRIASAFAVYEHEWPFLAGYLGEPFLIEDCIVYWDGQVANIAAFPLHQSNAPLAAETLGAIVATLPTRRPVELVHVWGDFEVADTVWASGRHLDLVDRSSLEATYPGEYTIDIASFTLQDHPNAVKAMRSVRNKGVTVGHRRLERFEADHYWLVETWRKTRDIGYMAACAASTLPAYCREDHVLVFEAFVGRQMLGFVVLARPVPGRAQLLLSFSEKFPGSRIHDALMHAAIAYCSAEDIHTLHCGYAGSETLASFKAKWGARCTGPSYRQAMYAAEETWRDRANQYCFYWKHRLLVSLTSEPDHPGGAAER